MTLTEICIKRPVFATVLSLAVLLIGLISYTRLTVREYPRIDEPIVSVDTTYKGASAEVMESQITKPLEDSISGIEGVDLITSSSRSERSQINVRFKLSRDPDSAAADVRDKVARARGKLPLAADEPIIAKAEADAQPVVWLALMSDHHTQMELSDYANRYIRPRLSVLPGAADVRIFGERKLSMRIWLDPARMAAYKVTVQDVEDALRRQNAEIPAGRIESLNSEFSVLSQTDIQRPEEFAAIIIRDANGYPVRLRDVGRAEIGSAEVRNFFRAKGKVAVGFGLIKQSTANPLELSIALRKEFENIKTTLPADMKFEIAYDSSVYIQESIKSVYETIFEAVILVALVIFLFLRNLRATLIPLVTIPVSLIGSFACMVAFGFSINTLTLLAMVLAIGLVVDDAIVVLENIYRNIEMGKTRLEAALSGAKEIAFAVLAMTITLAAVFAPIAFATGRTGRLFSEFALALAGSVLISGFVALTLTPMLCSQMLRHETRHGALYNAIERIFHAITTGYQQSLGWSLRHRTIIVITMLIFGGAGAGLFLSLKSELAPTEDRGLIFGRLIGPEGATVPYTVRYLDMVEHFYSELPEQSFYFASIFGGNVNHGNAMLRLKPWDERTRSQADIQKHLLQKFSTMPGVTAFPSAPAPLAAGNNTKALEFVIQAQVPFEELQRYVDALTAEMAKNPNLVNVDSDLKLNSPELKVSVNRERVADTGANVESVGRTLETMLGGRLVTRFKRDGEQYDVIVQTEDAARTSPSDISDLYVRGKNGEMIQFANLLSVRESVAPRSLNHFQRLRSASITADFINGYTIGEALKFMQDAARRALPQTVQTDLGAGPSREFRDSSSDIYFVFLLALIFIYLVLAAQFESFIDPFIIMLTVPLSMTGALLALKLTGGTLNIYTQIGLITLVGLITKHGILIVEFANQLQEGGRSVHDAVMESAKLRLRPILMTTGAMVLGALPLAFSQGAGAEPRQQMGWAIVGGLSLGTLLTLFVVPVAYTLLARQYLSFDERLARQKQQQAMETLKEIT